MIKLLIFEHEIQRTVLKKMQKSTYSVKRFLSLAVSVWFYAFALGIPRSAQREEILIGGIAG